jgi:hypothetical protein
MTGEAVVFRPSAKSGTGDALPAQRARRPEWSDVERVLAELASAGTSFPTVLSERNRIGSYDSHRLMLDSEHGTQTIEIASIRACWETFERLGRVSRRDVLEPGRCSAFIFALFRLIPGVREDTDGEHYLLLPRPEKRRGRR